MCSWKILVYNYFWIEEMMLIYYLNTAIDECSKALLRSWAILDPLHISSLPIGPMEPTGVEAPPIPQDSWSWCWGPALCWDPIPPPRDCWTGEDEPLLDAVPGDPSPFGNPGELMGEPVWKKGVRGTVLTPSQWKGRENYPPYQITLTRFITIC